MSIPSRILSGNQQVIVIEDSEDDSKILRFQKSERLVHWSLAIPFLMCYTSALILVLVYNPDPTRPYRMFFSWFHRFSGLCLLIMPMLAIMKSRGNMSIHFYNIRQAWIWGLDDIKWLVLKGLAAMNSRIKLPEQGKFNAAEKLNFMVLMATYPIYIITGLIMWFSNAAVISWVVHVLMALLATPLILGHIYMACVNADTRTGLSGMFSGKVDRKWAKHHYGNWYREHFEKDEKIEDAIGEAIASGAESISNDTVIADLYSVIKTEGAQDPFADADIPTADDNSVSAIGRRAIDAHLELLEIYSPEDHPLQYATTKRSLGRIYSKLAEHEEPVENYRQAAQAYEEAMDILCRPNIACDRQAVKN